MDNKKNDGELEQGIASQQPQGIGDIDLGDGDQIMGTGDRGPTAGSGDVGDGTGDR
jgi:hypothetical protein